MTEIHVQADVSEIMDQFKEVYAEITSQIRPKSNRMIWQMRFSL